jgi:two-component system cell cycle sensor histidine kinase/response regulator CckA
MLLTKDRSGKHHLTSFAQVLLPMVVFSLLLISNVSGYLSARAMSEDLAHTQCRQISEQMTARLHDGFRERTNDIALLADDWRGAATTDRIPRFTAAATDIIDHEPTYHEISYVDEQGFVRASVPVDTYTRTAAKSASKISDQVPPRPETLAAGRPFVSSSVSLPAGSMGIVLWYPILERPGNPRTFAGSMAATFHIEDIATQFSAEPGVPSEFWVVVQHNGSAVIDTSTPDDRAHAWLERLGATMVTSELGRTWTVSTYPRSGSVLARMPSQNLLRFLGSLAASSLATGLLTLVLVASGRIAESRQELLVKDSAIASSINAIALMDLGGNITYVNQAFLSMWGYEDESQVRGRRIAEFGDQSPATQEALAAARARASWAGELVAVRKDGSRFHALVSASVVRDADQNAVCLLASCVDITGRKQTQTALRESEQQKAIILDNLAELISYQDRDFVIQWANRAAAEAAGTSLEKLVGSRCFEIRRAEDSPCPECPIAACFESGRVERREVVNPDGRTYLSSACPVRDSEGNVIGAVETSLEITERKRAESERERLLAQVQEQAARVQLIIDTVPEGVTLLDTEGEVLAVNPDGGRHLQTLADAQVGDTLARLGDHALAEVLGSPNEGQWNNLQSGNRQFEAIARPLASGPEDKGWVLVTRDVTDKRAVQQRIQRQDRLASVGQLAAGIAHDFNNIMSTIILYSQMLSQEAEISAHSHERLETVKEQARHATRLIQQILDFSRRSVLERQPLDLEPLLKEQIKLLQRTLPESITVRLSYGTHEYTVNADPTRIQQAIMNLALNARDAMPSGGQLRIALKRVSLSGNEPAPLPGMGPGDWVIVSVADTGTGIPPDALPHIYDPFYTTKPVGVGTGLGLAQVYGIVKQHEGDIVVESATDQGTTFTIYLPALPIQPTEEPVVEHHDLVGGAGEVILLVEDNPATRNALIGGLKLLNYQVISATDGLDALDILERQSDEIALVLSDVVMPAMGGAALLNAMADQGYKARVVLITGHPLDADLQHLHPEQLVDVLSKPINLDQLAEVVRRGIQSRTH